MKKISTLLLVMFALLTSQSVMAQQDKTDPDFRYAEPEVTYDLAAGEAFKTPELLIPKYLKIDKYAVSHTEMASVDEKTGEVTITATTEGDISVYAVAKKNGDKNNYVAELKIHIVNTGLVSSVVFGTETNLGCQGDGGWNDYDGYWMLTQTEWWIAGQYNYYMTGYTEAYLVSPQYELAAGSSYAVEFVHACYYKEAFKENNKLMIREVGGEWVELQGVGFPEPESYAKASSGKVSIPAEFEGKMVEFAFKNIATHSADDSNWSIKSFTLSRVKNTPTGIESVEVKPVMNNKIYDLQGREVTNPAKGIFIQNGKKVIFK